jgi:hypothetical protein
MWKYGKYGGNIGEKLGIYGNMRGCGSMREIGATNSLITCIQSSRRKRKPTLLSKAK